MRGTRFFRGVALIVGFAAAVLLGTACNNASKPAGDAGKTTPASQPVHSVQVRQLKGLMQVISHTATTRWPKTMPTDVEQPVDAASQQKAYDQAAMLADSLAIAAGQIPAAADEKTLPEDVRSGFLAEARKLRDLAQQLKKDAQGERAESMQRTLDSINATCLNCHSKYRDLTGNIDFPRVRANRTGEPIAAR